MLKRIIIILAFILSIHQAEAQTTLYSENFNGSTTSWLFGAIDDAWIINSVYNCSGALTGATPNQGGLGYLHVYNDNHLPLNGGLCCSFYPASGNATIYTSMIQTLNTVGFDSVVVSFQWLCGGNINSYGTFQYSIDGGVNFSSITIPIDHFYGQTSWTSYSLNSGQLPALLNKNLLKFRFGFINGNSGSNPAFAIDNFLVKGYSLPTFNLSLVETYNNLCAGNHLGRARVIATGGTSAYSYQWYNSAWAAMPTYTDSLQTALTDGSYWVVAHDAANHWDTVQVIISNSNPPISVEAGPDKAICLGNNTQLNGTGGIYFNWTPIVGLNNATIYNPIATPVVSTLYQLTALAPVGDVITNGSFTLGNVGFTSDYGYSSSLMNQGMYYVTDQPYTTNPGYVWNCFDHTVVAANDNMMVVNGSNLANVNVWCQTIPIIPNTTYAFSTWVMCVNASNPAILQFSINGSLLGTPFTADPTQCLWKNFYELWNSGINTTATICVVNQNTINSGNDFALDDITFSPLCQGRDSVKVQISIPLANAGNDTVVCNSNPVTLIAHGGVSYAWNTSPQQNTQQITVNPSVTTTYTVTVTDSINCIATDQVLVTVGNLPAVNLGNDTVLCQGQSLLLYAGSGYTSYLWNNASSNATLNVNTPGTFWVRASNNCGTSIDTIHVSYAPPVNLNLGNDTTLCYPNVVQLNAGSGFSQYHWNDGSQLQTYNVSQTGYYSVTVSNSTACQGIDSIHISVVQVSVNLGNDTTICSYDNITLDAGNQTSTYLWNDGSGLQTFAVNSAGTYWVEVTTQANCKANDTIQIQYYPSLVVSLGNDTTLCSGNSITLNPGNFTNYLWESGSTSSSQIINSSGVYWVKVSDNHGCSATDSILLAFHALPVINLGNDKEFCSTDNMILDAGNGYSFYLWQNGSNLRYFQIEQPGLYWVSAGYPDCSSSDTLEVFPCQELIIPNVFTPNNDGTNDVFLIIGKTFETYDLKIFNRWGSLIFETHSANEGWNGEENKNPCSSSVYYYTLEYTDKFYPLEVKRINGSVTLLR